MKLVASKPREPKSRHLKQLIKEFAASYPSFNSQRGAYNKCKLASYELVLFLRKRGFPARLVHLQGVVGGAYPNPHPVWAKKRRDRWSHYVVGLGRWSIDLTAKQFDSAFAVPHVETLAKLRETWTKVEDDKFLNGWVDEVLATKHTM